MMMDDWIWIWIGFGLLLMPLQFLMAAPYGRHTSGKWGPLMNNKVGWVVMESVALISFLTLFVSGQPATASIVIGGLFILHYVHRSFIYPFLTRTSGKKIPVVIVIFAILFNTVNGSINGAWLGDHPLMYTTEWLGSWQFISGSTLFVVGAVINLTSDYKLISLRASGRDYQIPRRGLFDWISCPNHFGEIIEWTGFAVMCWSLPALAFAIWTISNLVPRAWQHHKWYRSHFEDYPENRKAVLPGVL